MLQAVHDALVRAVGFGLQVAAHGLVRIFDEGNAEPAAHARAIKHAAPVGTRRRHGGHVGGRTFGERRNGCGGFGLRGGSTARQKGGGDRDGARSCGGSDELSSLHGLGSHEERRGEEPDAVRSLMVPVHFRNVRLFRRA